MPAPGEQHQQVGTLATANPFEEIKPKISEYTAQEIATLQSRLEKQLGPEYISSRAGPGGQKVHYIAAEKCIQLANEVFGFNGWSSQIMNTQVDFVDESPTTGKVSLGLSVIVRVTLRDGTFHEDVGYGHIDNCKGKAPAFEKAKKEGTTDALKRALRNFGNVLGNCIYDKDYLSKVTKVKAQPTKWDVDKLHRHSTYAPPVKKEPEAAKPQEEKQSGANMPTEESIDDEFGDFDEADFSVSADSDSHPDEVVLPGPPASRHFNGTKSTEANPMALTNQSRAPLGRAQSMAAPARPKQVGGPLQAQAQPQTPNSGFARSTSASGPGIQRAVDAGAVVRGPIPGPGRVLNQPSRNIPQAAIVAPESPARQSNPSSMDEPVSLPPPGAGFFSAKAASMIPEGQNTDALPQNHPQNLPVFNPHAESPSIRKTPGVDHKSSKPTTRDLKHVPSSSQAAAPAARPNIINPSIDTTRRIGAPGSPSPMSNRGQYKPPSMKRTMDNTPRTPLVDLPANGAIGPTGPVGDAKRQRLSGP
ncbi:DNA repair and recombination protein rhm52 [Phlyctema vagabunda]|uniref:DNA repair and recombination protein rhm52 n=1 Tax=Phlyctema vagabunda TaxID=108571 RepID=A0ABR4PM70_9HELO